MSLAARPPMPRIATRLNHVAYPTFDTAATMRFYPEIMGFRLVDAIRGEIPPHRFLHRTDRPRWRLVVHLFPRSQRSDARAHASSAALE
jgi:hypothetical protein